MDNEIKEIVSKVINYHIKNNQINILNTNELIDLVLSKKDKFDPNKGKLESYFTTMTRRYMILLHKRDEAIIKRDNRIQRLINKHGDRNIFL